MSIRPEASPELILSSPLRNECEIFCVDSDEEVCAPLGQKVCAITDKPFEEAKEER